MASNPQSSNDGTRKHELEIELEASPQEVFEAVSQGDKIQQWFAPEVRVTPGVGGSVYMSWGPGMGAEAPINIWEPNERVGWVEGPGTDRARQVTWEITAASGSTTKLKLVHSGFGAGAEFDGEYESTYGGWMTFLAMLQDGMRRFRGVRGCNVSAFRMAKETSQPEAWKRVQTALGLTATEEGAAFTSSVLGPATVVKHPRPGCLCLSIEDAVLGVFVEGKKKAMVTFEWVLYGDAAIAARKDAVQALIDRVADEAVA